eukprot:TRINITY_DN20880_c0_g1_i1.p1 TRINITY_DN20880_c0_g1~~TRINITY_DN20880_c0_g1_i1.p1  ORF type:complete len:272 (-),score=-2.48 TRINITY_DN20880_c0_g1_i1:89-904(-)
MEGDTTICGPTSHDFEGKSENNTDISPKYHTISGNSTDNATHVLINPLENNICDSSKGAILGDKHPCGKPLQCSNLVAPDVLENSLNHPWPNARKRCDTEGYPEDSGSEKGEEDSRSDRSENLYPHISILGVTNETSTQSESVRKDRSSSLAEDGRLELPTCGSVSPILPPHPLHPRTQESSVEWSSVFYSSKDIFLRHNRTRPSDIRATYVIGLTLGALAGVTFFAFRREMFGTWIGIIFFVLSLAALGMGSIRGCCLFQRRRRYDYESL